MSEKGRIAWLDAAKGIAIASVVAAHSIGGEWSNVLSPIRMPIFFVAAGFTLNLQKWQNRKYDFFRSRVERLLIPYFLLELLFWPIWSVRGMFLPRVGTELPPIEALGGILGGNSVDLPLIALWFLPCFFLAENIFLWLFPADRALSMRSVLTALILSVLGYKLGSVEHLPWGLDIALFAQGFILTGRWLCAKGLENLSGIWSLFLPLFLLAAQSHVNDYFNMAARMYGSYPLLAYAAAIGGSILLMRIMQLLVHDAASDAHGCASADAGAPAGTSLRVAGRAAFASAFPAEMGRRSMAIYVLHPFVQIIITDALLCTFINGDYGTVFNLWQAGIPITVLGILIPVYVSRHWAQKPILRHLGI